MPDFLSILWPLTETKPLNCTMPEEDFQDTLRKKMENLRDSLPPSEISIVPLTKDFFAIVDKEMEIIKAELANSGKPADMIDKIAKGKLNKFISDNTLLNQIWIMDPKKKVSDILKENKIEVLDFVRFKVGEGV